MDDVMNEPARFARWQVVAMYTCYPVGAVLAIVATGPDKVGGLALFLPGAALIVASYCLLALLARTRFWRPGNIPAPRLDERELALHHRAHRRAYEIVGALPLVGLVYAALALDNGRLWLPRDFEEANIVFWGVFLLVVSLPSATLAWDRETV